LKYIGTNDSYIDDKDPNSIKEKCPVKVRLLLGFSFACSVKQKERISLMTNGNILKLEREREKRNSLDQTGNMTV